MEEVDGGREETTVPKLQLYCPSLSEVVVQFCLLVPRAVYLSSRLMSAVHALAARLAGVFLRSAVR